MTEILDLRPYLNRQTVRNYFLEHLPHLKLEVIEDFLNSIYPVPLEGEAVSSSGEDFIKLLQRAGFCLVKGGLVAFPTETVYGLGANAMNPAAVKKIFRAKGRPHDNPLIVHISSFEELPELVEGFTGVGERLAEEFWPGPLTLVLPKKAGVPGEVTAGLDTVAVRMPAHPLALALIHEAGVPVAAPSANLSGRPSPTRAEHVREDLQGKIEMILDGGPCPVGLESTVIDCTRQPPVILRPGGLALEILREEVPVLELDPALKAGEKVEKALSPGMKYRHYSPHTPVILYEGSGKRLKQDLYHLVAEGQMIGLLVREPEKWKNWIKENLATPSKVVVRPLSSYTLFSELRALDRGDIKTILVEGCSEHGLGLAIMNRLRKAATRIYF